MNTHRTICRHSRAAIFMHWFNALCWFILLATGFALLANPCMQPMGAWWPQLWHGFPSLVLHQVTGIVWALVCAGLALSFWNSVSLPFLREILTLSPRVDGVWCWRKAQHLTLGEQTMRRMGLPVQLPAQGFYNAGQKYVAILAVGASVFLVSSGVLLCLAPYLIGLERLVQWAIWVHFCGAGLMAVALPVHIYMAAFAPGERPALLSMFHGHVPLAFVRNHNSLWYEDLQKQRNADDVAEYSSRIPERHGSPGA